MEKLFVKILKKSEQLSAISIRLVKITGKSRTPLHPKHLVKKNNIWFKKNLKKTDFLLDIGSGIGADSIAAAKYVHQVTGLDINIKSLEIAKKNLKDSKLVNVKYIKHDGNNKLPFKQNSFDKVLCSDVLEHLDNVPLFLRELRRVLKKNGLLLLVTDNPDTSWKKLLRKHKLFSYADPDHRREYSKEEILKILKKHGFKVVSVATVSYDTPYKGLIDLTGGISLSLYKKLGKWKQRMLEKHPEDTSSYKIIGKLL